MKTKIKILRSYEEKKSYKLPDFFTHCLKNKNLKMQGFILKLVKEKMIDFFAAS